MSLKKAIHMLRHGGKRSLVVEILIAQLAYAAIIAAVAVTSLTSGANWVIRNNVSGWAERWIDDLDSLGVGLYSDDKAARYAQIKSYLEKFPEISFIRYYDPSGVVIFQDIAKADGSLQAPTLTQDNLLELRLRAAESEAHEFTKLPENMGVSLSKAVITTKVDPKDLAEADSLASLKTHKEIVGFVELGLDYSHYDEQLAARTAANLKYGVGIFLSLALLGWWMLRRALQPLRDIQRPLARLAEGQTELDVQPSAHKEINAITEGLLKASQRIAQRDAHLTFLAHHDELTGLPNRAALMAELSEVLQGPQRPLGGLLFIDLDQFKYVNDTLGHQVGDSILVQAANRLKQALGDFGTLARLSGDEFCVVASGATARASQKMAEHMLQHLTMDWNLQAFSCYWQKPMGFPAEQYLQVLSLPEQN